MAGAIPHIRPPPGTWYRKSLLVSRMSITGLRVGSLLVAASVDD